MATRKRKTSGSTPDQGGNIERIKSVVAAAADPELRRNAFSVPSFLSESALQGNDAEARQVNAAPTPLETPVKTRSAHIGDIATGKNLSSRTLRLKARGMGLDPSNPEHLAQAADTPDSPFGHFAHGASHLEK